ncbi:endonuclease 8-like 1 [Discoglossus pictus]
MPEGPELHLASLFVNTSCAGLLFSGNVEKSAVSKNTEVPFSCPEYTISSVSRGKEVKLLLSPVSGDCQTTDIVFRFGMSGSFKLCSEAELPKHAHLRFYTKDTPRRVLCFVDPRRFGTWEVNGTWQPDRGPCVMQEYDKFRDCVLRNLSDKAFDKPICEALLNQKYFNGIGNYLRAEILFRLQIPPFVPARPILEDLKHQNQNNDTSLSKKVKLKKENPDLLQLCHLVPLEVIKLGGKGYDPEKTNDYADFEKWLRCYYAPGMNALRDHNGRTIWFQGDPGPLAPKGEKARKRRLSVGTESKPVKVEKTEVKRKAGGGKRVLVKKELKSKQEVVQDLKVESEEEKSVDERSKKKVKKVGDKKIEKEKNIRRSSYKGSPLHTPIRPKVAKKDVPQLTLDHPPAKTKSKRLKASAAPLDSPKPKIREVKKTAGRRSTAKPKS